MYNSKSTIFNIETELEGRFRNKLLNKAQEKISDKNYECLVIGNCSQCYLYLDKYTNFKYFFQYPIVEYDRSILNETIDYIKTNKPKLVFIMVSDENSNVILSKELVSLLYEEYNHYFEDGLEYFILK